MNAEKIDLDTWMSRLSTRISDEDLADLYEAAADYIETHGWARWRFEDDNGGVCLTGAIGVVLQPDVFQAGLTQDGVLGPWRYAVKKLVPFLPPPTVNRPGVGDYWSVVVNWNNEQAADQYEVIDLLRHAAKEVRA